MKTANFININTCKNGDVVITYDTENHFFFEKILNALAFLNVDENGYKDGVEMGETFFDSGVFMREELPFQFPFSEYLRRLDTDNPVQMKTVNYTIKA